MECILKTYIDKGLTDMSEHYEWLDLAKGIGIIMVVIGHTFFPIHALIDFCHMPLFFVLAGLTLKKETKFTDYLIKKINRIFVPLLFFSFCSDIIAWMIHYEGGAFNWPLWFLNALFGALIITQIIIQKCPRKCRILILLALAVYNFFACRYSVFIFSFKFDTILRAVIFVLLGYEIKDLLLRDLSRVKYILFALCCSIIYLLCVYLLVYRFGCSKEGIAFAAGDNYGHEFFLDYLTSLSGVLAIFFISKLFGVIKPVNWLGKYSLIIMCVHDPFTGWLNAMAINTSWYQGNLMEKACLCLIMYAIIILFSAVFVPLFRKLVPKFTGFEPLLTY